MGNKRIYELAKELKKSSKDVVEKAQQLGIDVKNHMGAITSSDGRNYKARLKNPRRNNKLHNKQAENQPINSRTINVKKKQQIINKKIKITAVIKIAV